MASYSYKGPVDSSIEPDLSNLKGKSAVVTGGANGIGKAYVEALAKAGVYVTIGDIDEADGSAIIKAHQGSTQFVKCDVRSWDDQVKLFKTAIVNSPSKSIDIVVANAGISGVDEMFRMTDPEKDPEKPDLKILDINLYGVMYTAKLAFHYFQKNSNDDQHDKCFVVQASLAGYIDLPGAVQYQVSKYGGRAIMVCTRHHPALPGYRVNAICPWFVHTAIMSDQIANHLKSGGVKFATVDDCAKALLRIAADKSVHGRAFAILPRDKAKDGYRDIDMDDYGEENFLQELIQELSSASSYRADEQKREWWNNEKWIYNFICSPDRYGILSYLFTFGSVR